MTDDDVIGVFDYKDISSIDEERPSTAKYFLDRYDIKLGPADILQKERLRDGKYLLAILRGGAYDRRAKRPEEEIKDGDFELTNKKTMERQHNRPNTYKDMYKWENEKAEDLFRNPYWRNKTGRWSDRKNYEKAMNNVRNGRHFWDDNEK